MERRRDDLPDEVRETLGRWLEAHDRHAPGMIDGLYVVGSVALDDLQPGSDVDIVAVTNEPTDDEAALRLGAAASEMRQNCRRHIDGPYLSRNDLSRSPASALRPWVLDGEFHFDANCFELNPVLWYTLAAKGIAMRGVQAADLGVAINDDELHAWVAANTQSYWAPLAEEYSAHVEQSDEQEFASANLEWSVLGIARMWFTMVTGDVASKSEAGHWASRQLAEHSDIIEMAVAVRAQPAMVSRKSTLSGIDALFAMLAELQRLEAAT